MNAAEILWRARSAISSNLDLVRIPFGLYPKIETGGDLSIEQFARGFECSPVTNGFGSNHDTDLFVSWRERLLRKADAIRRNHLAFFDRVDQYVGDPVDWHKDFSSGKTAPASLSNLIDYRNFDAVGDCKLVWEPNRHHQLVVLARAYKVTGEKAYAVKVADLMHDWIVKNPFGYGMNWKSPLEVGIRVINWVWAIDLVREANIFSENAWNDVLQTVYRSLWDIQRKFSQGTSANNHLIGEAAGVFIATSYFPALPNSDEWREASHDILEHEILAQSYPDGCTREHAFGYQFFVIQFLTLSMLSGERSGMPFSPEFTGRLHRMYRFMADLCADTGRPPNLGDSDDGYVLDLGELPEQSREVLSVGGHLFRDNELFLSEASESAFWLFGNGRVIGQEPSNTKLSNTYKDSGYHILRANRQPDKSSRNIRVFFDCAELGYGSIAAHGHADCLSFTLAVDGQEILVDPGTYDYFTYPEWRDYFRSTRAHNTLTVDGECQSESLGPFMWGARAEARLLDWHDDQYSTHVSGEHTGYMRLSGPTLHKRTVILHKESGSIEIFDRLITDSTHTVRVYFHTAPGSESVVSPDGNIWVSNGKVKLEIGANTGEFEILHASECGHSGWVSNGYHRKEKGQCIVLEVHIDGGAEIVTDLVIGDS